MPRLSLRLALEGSHLLYVLDGPLNTDTVWEMGEKSQLGKISQESSEGSDEYL